jgi:DNA-binding NarL/FixJ family response regulator
MPQCVSTYVYSDDRILQAGVVSQLRPRAEVDIVGSADLCRADVAIVVADALDDATLRILRSLHKAGVPHLISLLASVNQHTVAIAAEAGVSGLLRRGEATPDALVRTVTEVATGKVVLPPDLICHLLDQVSRLQRQLRSPHGVIPGGLSAREVEVLRLIADGLGTEEIARTLCYSQRTVKSVLHGVTTRLQLRNRSHAVAYAVREGLI